jgi:hypothetical protein
MDIKNEINEILNQYATELYDNYLRSKHDYIKLDASPSIALFERQIIKLTICLIQIRKYICLQLINTNNKY